MSRPRRILIITRGFGAGGAERQLLEFLKNVDTARLSVVVVFFYREIWHSHLENLTSIDRFASLNKKGRFDLGPFLWRLYRIVREHSPDLIYGYSGAMLPSFVAAKLTGRSVVWAIRNSEPVPLKKDRLGRLAGRVCCFLARWVDGYLANSQAGAAAHIAAGYLGDRMTVIANGIDTTKFRKDPVAGFQMRQLWEIPENTILVGLVGRLDRRKNHTSFLRAVSLAIRENPDIACVCIGGGDADYQRELKAVVSDMEIADRVRWIDHMEDMTSAYNALDIFVLPSFIEGFPNVLCEAMACERAVIASDVGDTREIIGQAGVVVASGTAETLSSAMLDLCKRDRVKLGIEARSRIVNLFNTSHMVKATTAYLIAAASSR